MLVRVRKTTDVHLILESLKSVGAIPLLKGEEGNSYVAYLKVKFKKKGKGKIFAYFHNKTHSLKSLDFSEVAVCFRTCCQIGKLDIHPLTAGEPFFPSFYLLACYLPLRTRRLGEGP